MEKSTDSVTGLTDFNFQPRYHKHKLLLSSGRSLFVDNYFDFR